MIPVRPEERLYFTICHLTAGFVNAYLVGGMVAAITALNARNQSFYNSMDILNRFLTEKRLNARNPRLCERLRSYYIFRHNEGDGDGWKDIVLRTSREMQGEVVQELHSDWLRRVHYFSGVDAEGNEWEVDDDFKLQLSLSMSVEVVAPMETVFKEDSPIDQLYVIQQGVVGCKGHVLKKGDPFGEDVLVYYSPEVLDEQEFRTRYGARWVCRPNGRGYRATAMTNVLLLAFPGDAIHELLDRPKYEYIKRQVRRKMFVWQVRHVMLTMYRALTEAVAADTYADGMQVLLQQYGFEMMQNVPTINERYMIMREAKGDDEVKVMRLFRKMWNRKRFIAAVEGLVRKRRRERALVEVRDELKAKRAQTRRRRNVRQRSRRSGRHHADRAGLQRDGAGDERPPRGARQARVQGGAQPPGDRREPRRRRPDVGGSVRRGQRVHRRVGEAGRGGEEEEARAHALVAVRG